MADNIKPSILKYLGAGDKNELKEILSNHLAHDFYKENSENIYDKILAQNSDKNFFKDAQDFHKKQIESNYKNRTTKSLVAIPFYALSTILLLFGYSLFLVIGVSILTTLLLGIAESREKRNTANLGHSLEHLAEANLKNITEIFKNNEQDLTETAKDQIADILGIKNPDNLKSKVTRAGSYVSGPIVSGFRSIYSFARNLSNTSTFNIIFGSIIPILPLANTGLSYQAASFRYESIEKINQKFEKVANILEDKNSYIEPEKFASEILQEQFKTLTNNSYTKDKGPYLSGDNNSNIKKIISFPNWLGNKIRNLIPAPKKFKTEDVTKKTYSTNTNTLRTDFRERILAEKQKSIEQNSLAL